MITLGGNAELELVDSLDPFSEGIIFSVMPPKKSWKNISNLSGGEKTLSSLALVFALHVFKVSLFLGKYAASSLIHFGAISLPRCTSWTRSMQLWISETFPLWRIISRTARKMRNSSSLVYVSLDFTQRLPCSC